MEQCSSNEGLTSTEQQPRMERAPAYTVNVLIIL